MYQAYAKSLLAAVLMTSIGGVAVAQNSNKENSPYSRYGVGDQRSGTNILLRGMGGISTAYASPYAVNPDNPASYAWLRFTTYEGAAEAHTRTVSNGEESYRTGTVDFSYMRIGVPLGKNAGFVLGLQPQSRTYFHLADTGYTAGLGQTSDQYFGDGSLNYAFIGAGAKFKNFGIGANFGYLFGSSNTSTELLSLDLDSPYSFNSRLDKNFTIGGIYFNLGAQYQALLSKKLMLRLGATAKLKQDLDVYGDQYYFSYRNLSDGGSVADTVVHASAGNGKLTLPSSYSFGVQLASTDNWLVGVDVSTTNWSEFRNMGYRDSVTDRSYKIGVGGEFTPDPTSYYNYFQRVSYRLGFNYGKDYVRLDNKDLNYYSVSIGASFPFKHGNATGERQLNSRIHTTLEIGTRGNSSNGLLKENFVQFSAGISLNDRWFIKRKYD